MIRFPPSGSLFICMSFFWSCDASTLPGLRSFQQMITGSLVNGGGIQIGRLWGTGTGPSTHHQRDKMHNNSQSDRLFTLSSSPEMDSVTSSTLHNST
jgi:hypothetical protein